VLKSGLRLIDAQTLVQLYVVQELFSVLDAIGESSFSESAELITSEEQVVMAVSVQAIQGAEHVSSMRILGYIQGKEVLILVDSGSTASFLSSKVADQLSGVQLVLATTQVKVANGAVLSCTAELPDCVWTTQGHVFYTTFKILALTNYDAILGMDWLMQCSPMSVDWVQKSLVICWQGKSVTLQGIVPELQQCQMISTQQLKEFDDRRAVAHFVQLCSLDDKESSEQIPVKIQHVLQEFNSVFDEPMGLPPTRSFDHTIPLIPGAVPVNVRPYRYTPAQKDEIEQQVREMLDKGIIQPSSSPFSSPVLLVKKKDGTWRFCVDYRHLNVITVKNKYPLPIIDELLDELSRAQWFTKLDLRAGYHQIRMKMSDEHKTAFKTHSGHYEFRVIPFGLTSAPSTFQGGMNSILSPLLRRCVLVFVDDILIYSATLEDHVNHLRQLFQILVKHQLKVKQSKCSFAQQRLSYLGHIITPNGVSTDDDKIRVVQNWPVPGSVKELRSFLGLTGYYRKFVCHYGILSKPLTNLLRKGQLYSWTSETEAAFQALKQALITAPVLAMPNFSLLRRMLPIKALVLFLCNISIQSRFSVRLLDLAIRACQLMKRRAWPLCWLLNNGALISNMLNFSFERTIAVSLS
jgi:hypothetical protein